MPWAHCLALWRCLGLLAVALSATVPSAAAVGAAAVQPAIPTNVSSPAELLAALQDPSVTNILLEGTVQLGDLSNATLPIRFESRRLTIAGPAPLAVNGSQPALGATAGALLDFQGIWPLLVLGNNASLALQDVSVQGVPPVAAAAGAPYPWRAAQVLPPGFMLGGWALALYPSIILENKSQVLLERTRLSRMLSTCSDQNFADSVSAFQALLGGDVQLLSSHSALVQGNHTFPLLLRTGPFDSPVDAGTASLVLVGPNVFACSQPGSDGGAAGSDGGSGGLSGGAWAGIAIGIAVAVAAAAGAAAAIFLRRRRAHSTGSSVSAAGRPGRGTSTDSSSKPAEGEAAEASAPSLELLRRQQAAAGVDSLLRLRFGGLEGLELGSLVGRGAFGRVYNGRLRGVPVAVKVVEHSIDADAAPGGGASGPATEALLLTSLSHPCIVSVFKTATLKVQGAGRLSSANVGSSPGASGAEAAGQPSSNAAAVGSAGPSTGSVELAGPFAASPAAGGSAGAAAAAAAAAPAPAPAGGASPGEAPQPSTPDTSVDPAASDMGPVNLAALEAGQAVALAARSSSTSGQHSAGSTGGAGRGSGHGGRGSRGAAPVGGSPPSSLVPTEPGQYETWIVMQYCEMGSLEQAIQRRLLWRPDGTRREAVVYGILVDIAEGLCYLHEANVVHGDLKPGNVLLKSAGQGRLRALIADFGLSKLLPCGQRSLVRTQVLGTAQYAPPEALTAGRISRATDIYSLAMIILEAFSGAPAFPGLSVAAVFYSVVLERQRPALPPDMPLPLAALVSDCWQQQPQDRPPIQQVLTRLREVQAAAAAKRGER